MRGTRRVRSERGTARAVTMRAVSTPAVAAMATVVAAIVFAGPAHAVAQTAPEPATCSQSVKSASPGDVVTARIQHVSPGTQVTLRIDGGSAGDAVADPTGAAAVRWTVPADAFVGEHTAVFVGENVYCDSAPEGFPIVSAAAVDPPSGPALAEGTVGAAAGRAPVETGAKPASPSSGTTPAVIAFAIVGGAAIIGGGAQVARVALRRRRRQRPSD